MFIENKVLSGNDEQRLLSFWAKYYIQLYDER